jgi:CheY-like chemotaxis protein
MGKLANAILTIDDEPQIRRFVRGGLESYGHSIHLAETDLKRAAPERRARQQAKGG